MLIHELKIFLQDQAHTHVSRLLRYILLYYIKTHISKIHQLTIVYHIELTNHDILLIFLFQTFLQILFPCA